MSVRKASARIGLTGTLLLVLLGALSGCADRVLGPQADDIDCIIIAGQIHCN